MRPALPRQNDGRGKQKKVDAAQEGDETDPLLSSGLYPVRTIRRRSPLTATSLPMRYSDASQQSDEVDRYSHQPSQYTLHTDDTAGQFMPDGTLGTRTETTSSKQERHNRKHGAQKPAPNKPCKESSPPLLEIPEEIYAIRKAALQVLKPLTASWLVVSVGFALSVLLGMARWTRLMTELPYWFILIPSWCSHVGLLWCHIKSAQALSRFIAEANDNRQRPDSTDHFDRTEYLPLLQRSLKFGLKTGLLSFCTFVFEVLIYMKIARGHISLAVAFTPIWILVVGGILDGIVCKSQHFLRVFCWILICTAMVLSVLRVDYGMEDIRWRIVVSPIVAVLSISSATLIYIVYGHQVGYYRLTESQLTAGILYSISALICIVLVVVIGEVMPLTRPVEIETRMFVVIMAPMIVCLTGMGAYAVSRDEFGRLLLYGGQSTVHPMKLKWEANGWTSVPTRGVTVLAMFGEVSYRPLVKEPGMLSFCMCCSCYPYEDEDEEIDQDAENWRLHPYLSTAITQHKPIFLRGRSGYDADNASESQRSSRQSSQKSSRESSRQSPEHSV